MTGNLLREIMLTNKDNVSMNLAIAMDAAKAVSFDLFDTLFVRSVLDPREVFDLMGQRFGIARFRDIRELAQAEAFRRMVQSGRKEISLQDIYACMTELLPSNTPCDELCEAEYQLELAVTSPNPVLQDIFLQAVASKPVVITSDMYLPRRFFDELLEKHGLPPVPLFVSSERNATKRDRGELFDLVASELGILPSDILHIGDNLVSDVERALERGFQAFHYVSPFATEAVSKQPLGVSIARSMVKLVPAACEDTFYGLGYRYGGPAALGFLGWIAERARKDGIDFLLFISRDGFILERMASDGVVGDLPSFAYFPGSRVAFGLAATDESNFDQQIDFMLAGSHGLTPIEVLERMGVQRPCAQFMTDLALGDHIAINNDNMPAMRGFLSAYRSEILKCCRRNRRGLFNLLCHLGIKPGLRVAMVDVGWSGTTQETLQRAMTKLFSIELTGYYLCLIDTPESLGRRRTMKMHAVFDSASIGQNEVKQLYEHRTSVELLFSAPHHAVIGYETKPCGAVTSVEDPGRGCDNQLNHAVIEVQRGIRDFEKNFRMSCGETCYKADYNELASQLFDLVAQFEQGNNSILNKITNFDAWGSSRRHTLTLRNYAS